MMTTKLDLADSLGAIIGAGSPTRPSAGPAFAEIVAAAGLPMVAVQAPVIADAQSVPKAVDQVTADAPAISPKIISCIAPDTCQPQPTRVDAVASKDGTQTAGAGPSADRAADDAKTDTSDNAASIGVAPCATMSDAGIVISPAIVVIDGALPYSDRPPLIDPQPAEPAPIKPRIANRVVDTTEPVTRPNQVATAAIAAPTMVEANRPATRRIVDVIDPAVAAPADQRSVALAMPPTIDRSAPPLPDRMASFSPLIADAVRDLVTIAGDKDVRFNVRPESLGPVAVTIERGDAGPTLRLGVETPAAAQAVRNAEPALNDSRGNASFVQVTVDLTSPDGRGRTARAAALAQRGRGETHETIIPPPATAGRYA